MNLGSKAMNGSGHSGAQPIVGEATVVKIDFGLTGKQILAGFGAMATLIASGVTAGVLWMPAKESDLRELRSVVLPLQQIVQSIRDDQVLNKNSMMMLKEAVSELREGVRDLRDNPPRVTERVIVRPAKPRAAPPAKQQP